MLVEIDSGEVEPALPAGHGEEVRSLLSDLPAEKDAVLLHLLTCPACRDWAAGRLRRDLAEEAPGEYDAVFDRLQAALPRLIEEAGHRNAGRAAALRLDLPRQAKEVAHGDTEEGLGRARSRGSSRD
jgi:hypothetical protein